MVVFKKKDVKFNNPAFILGLSDTGLSVIHLLSDLGINIIGFSTSDEIGTYSWKCKTHKIPEPVGREDLLLDFLLKFTEENHCVNHCRPVLFATSDVFVYWIAENEDILKKYFLFNQPPKEITQEFQNKNYQKQLALHVGLKVPWTMEIDQQTNLDSIINKLTFPLLLKSIDSVRWQTVYLLKCLEITSASDLSIQLKEVFKTQDRVILQELIPGPETNLIEVSLLVAGGGKIISSISVRKIHQFPRDYGFGCLVVVDSFPKAEQLAIEFAQKNNLSGILNIEFKINERDGLLYYIETNLRSWQQIEITRFKGGNIPFLQYQLLIGVLELQYKETKHFSQYPIMWMDPIAEAFTLIINEPNLWKAFIFYCKQWRQSSIISSWYWNDPIPFLKKLRFGLSFLDCIKLILKKYMKPNL